MENDFFHVAYIFLYHYYTQVDIEELVNYENARLNTIFS